MVHLAEALTREILEESAGIRLSPREGEAKGVPLDAVCGVVDGGFRTQMQFRAEPRLFRRMACNMVGEPVDSEEEIHDSATEFFNILCGRFISEIYRQTHIPASFYPTRYVEAEEVPELGRSEQLETLRFISEERELAEFSWTMKSIELLLKRSERS